MCAHLHFNIRKETEVQLDKNHWYEHVPESVEKSQGGKVTVLWNQQVQTDRTVPNNKLDIIISDNEKGTYMLVDVAISGDRNDTYPHTHTTQTHTKQTRTRTHTTITHVKSTNTRNI